MSEMYRLRVVLDTDEDVIRDIVLTSDDVLSTLHEQIVKAFDLKEGEMASFFRSNEDWEQGEEISLVNFGDVAASELMTHHKLSGALPEQGSRMIYVYDFLKLWTFFVEVIDIGASRETMAPIIYRIAGERPQQAPLKVMQSHTFTEDAFEDQAEDSARFNWEDFEYDED